MTAPAIEAQGLGKTFGETPVLRSVNLTVRPGAGVLVLGGNGAGKSTLIKLFAGLFTPSSGRALVFGRPSGSLDPSDRRRLGVLTHQTFIYPNLTCAENLAFYAELYSVRNALAAADELLSKLGMTAVASARAATLSRGMTQRLSLARALIARPEVLLLDEPLAGLDRTGAEGVIRLIEDARSRGAAVVATAHEPALMGGLALSRFELRNRRLAEIESRLIDLPKQASAAG